MQRLFSLATLAVLGGLGYLIFRGGGLDQIVVAPRSNDGAADAAAVDGYQAPPSWTAHPVDSSSSWPKESGSGQTQFQATASESDASGPTIRIASFNIQSFGNTKAGKDYVMHTLADIVRHFEVVAIQEIRSKNEYLIPHFVELINQKGRQYDHVIGPRLGYTTVKEQYAFLFDSQRIQVDRQSVYTVGDPDGLLHRPPLVATFRTRGVDPDAAFTFTLVNTHTDPDVVPKELEALAQVYRVVRRTSRDEDDIILLGDFNADDRHLGLLSQLPGVVPLIIGQATNTRQSKQYDNLIIHRASTTEYSGRSGVFNVMRRYGRQEHEALEISDHFPVWAEFSVYELDYNRRVASHRQRARR